MLLACTISGAKQAEDSQAFATFYEKSCIGKKSAFATIDLAGGMVVKKRTLSWILMLCMVLSLFPVAAFAEEVEESEPNEIVTELETSAAMVKVTFVCTPENTKLSVFAAEAPESEIMSEADGSFLLPLGNYSYNAAAKGYESLLSQKFTISATDGEMLELKPVLTAVSVNDEEEGLEEEKEELEEDEDGNESEERKDPVEDNQEEQNGSTNTVQVNGLDNTETLTVTLNTQSSPLDLDTIIPNTNDTNNEIEVVQVESVAAANALLTSSPQRYSPNFDSSAYTDKGVNQWASYNGECTWYCGGRAYEKTSTILRWATSDGRLGNAREWLGLASANGYSTGTTPQANSIAVWESDGSYGHVAFVEEIDGNIAYITEANLSGTQYTEGYFDTNTGAYTNTLHNVTFSGGTSYQWLHRGLPDGYIYLSGGQSGSNDDPTTGSTDDPSTPIEEPTLIGVIENAIGDEGVFHVAGWAINEHDLSATVSVHVYVGGPAGSGAPSYAITADKYRSDVGTTYPGASNYHGIDDWIRTDLRGEQTIYFYVIDNYSNPLLGTKTVTVTDPTGIPIDEEHFPDATFRDYVEMYDSNNNLYLSDAEIAAATTLNLRSPSVASLSGIEYLTFLESMELHDTAVISLDLSNNTKLAVVHGSLNECLAELTLGNNSAMTLLHFPNSPIGTLDISGCPNLIAAVENGSTPEGWETYNCYIYTDGSGTTIGDLLVSGDTEIYTGHTTQITATAQLRFVDESGIDLSPTQSRQFVQYEEFRICEAGEDSRVYDKIVAPEIAGFTPTSVLFSADSGQQMTSSDTEYKVYSVSLAGKNDAGALIWSLSTQKNNGGLIIQSGTSLSGSLTIIYVYTSTSAFTVPSAYPLANYVDEAGDTIKASETLPLNANNRVEISSPDDTGWYNNLIAPGISGYTIQSITIVSEEEELRPTGYQIITETTSKETAGKIMFLRWDPDSASWDLRIQTAGTDSSAIDIASPFSKSRPILTYTYAANNEGTADGIAINETNFPDPIFRQYVADNFDTDETKGYLSEAEITAVTNIQVMSKNITSLKGLEFFTNLEVLWCPDNQITELNIENLPKLWSLDCWWNNISSLDISQNPLLLDAVINGEQSVGAGDMSRQAGATAYISDKGKLVIDPSVILITGVEPADDTPTFPDYALVVDPASLICPVGEPITMTVLTKGDGLTYRWQCWISDDAINSLDFTTNDLTLTAEASMDGYSYNCVIKNADGFQLDTRLTKITVVYKHIVQSGETLSNICASYGLDYDLCKNAIDMLNGGEDFDANNLAIGQEVLLPVSNASAARIAEPSTADGISINETNFPDPVFRQYVADNFDTDEIKGYLSEAEIATVTSIDCWNKDIASLKGVEFFTALTHLQATGNALTSLDVTKNTALIYLSAGANNLTSLDLSQNMALTWLDCYENPIAALDLSMNPKLAHLFSYYTNITEINVTNNPTLIEIVKAEEPTVWGNNGDILQYDPYMGEQSRIRIDKDTKLITSTTNAMVINAPASITVDDINVIYLNGKALSEDDDHPTWTRIDFITSDGISPRTCPPGMVSGKLQTLETYSYASGTGGEYPTGMEVWLLDENKETGGYNAVRADFLDDLLIYSGTSIRIKGNQGIAVHTTLNTAIWNQLIGGAYHGYRVEEAGLLVSVLSTGGVSDPVYGESGVIKGVSYERNGSMKSINPNGDTSYYMNTIVFGTDLSKTKWDLACRPFIRLTDSDGEEVILYGGTLVRSVRSVAQQIKSMYQNDATISKFIQTILDY